MNEPTRPPAIEADRLRLIQEMLVHVDDTVAWRIKQAEVQAEIRADVKYINRWIELHDVSDKENFARIERQLNGQPAAKEGSKLEIQLTGVERAVRFAGGLIVLVAAVGGLVIWVLKGGKP